MAFEAILCIYLSFFLVSLFSNTSWIFNWGTC